MAVEGKNTKRRQRKDVDGTMEVKKYGSGLGGGSVGQSDGSINIPKQRKRVSYDGTGRDTSGVLQREEQRDLRRAEAATARAQAQEKKKKQYEREFKAYQKYQQQQQQQKSSSKKLKNGSVTNKSGSKKKQKVRV